MKVLFLLPELNGFNTFSEAQGLAGHLDHQGWQTRTLVLGPGPHEVDDGGSVDYLGQSRWFDLAALWTMRRYLQSFQPDVIHAWTLGAVRYLALANWSILGRVALSHIPTSRAMRWMDRCLLRKVGQLIVHEPAEAAWLKRQGFTQVSQVPPGTETPVRPPVRGSHLRIACLGTTDVDQGFREAIWAFDVARYVRPELELLVVGAPADRRALTRFSESLGNRPALHFYESAQEASALAAATVVWVVGRGDASGPCLQAQANGRALITTKPSVVVQPGTTGLVVAQRDPVGLAKATRQLLTDEKRRDQIAAAGHRSAHEHFPLERTLVEYACAYRAIAHPATNAAARHGSLVHS